MRDCLALECVIMMGDRNEIIKQRKWHLRGRRGKKVAQIVSLSLHAYLHPCKQQIGQDLKEGDKNISINLCSTLQEPNSSLQQSVCAYRMCVSLPWQNHMTLFVYANVNGECGRWGMYSLSFEHFKKFCSKLLGDDRRQF